MNEETNDNDLQEIITQYLQDLKKQLGENYDSSKVNLAEMERITGISRGKLRKIKKDGFVVKPHGNAGKKAASTVLTGFTGVVDSLLQSGATNSSVIYDRIHELGYSGGVTTIKNYVSDHRELVPAKRCIVSPQGNRGRRYTTEPGECFQMDWGFVSIMTASGLSYQAACFVMVCHHCGSTFIEFFPNAKQENLFIGMLHGFAFLGVPKYILTDNMKSVVLRRDPEGHPIWQRDYEGFMKTVGFETKLCKPRHPFTKGKVERMVRFVKENFLAVRTFGTITDLNYEALTWCRAQNNKYHQSVDCIPDEMHKRLCCQKTAVLTVSKELAHYLCPRRRISFDGFINYEGRRFGVPYWYTSKTCRVRRDKFHLYIYDDALEKILTVHDVTWKHSASFCKDQYVKQQPEEFPTMPVKTAIFQLEEPKPSNGFEKFNFGEGIWDE